MLGCAILSKPCKTNGVQCWIVPLCIEKEVGIWQWSSLLHQKLPVLLPLSTVALFCRERDVDANKLALLETPRLCMIA